MEKKKEKACKPGGANIQGQKKGYYTSNTEEEPAYSRFSPVVVPETQS